MPSNGSAYHSLWTTTIGNERSHVETCSGILCLSNNETLLRRFDQAPPRNHVCDFTANFRLALLSAPLRRAPAFLAGSGKVLRV
jgi:hypothetical protein